MHNLSTATAQNLTSLECINLNSMAAKVPTHVLALGVQFIHRRRTSLYVSCIQPVLQNPNALGLRLYGELFTGTRPECTNTPLDPWTLFVDLTRPYSQKITLSIWMKVNTHLPRAYSDDPSVEDGCCPFKTCVWWRLLCTILVYFFLL